MPSENIQLLLKINQLRIAVKTSGVWDSGFFTITRFGPICLGRKFTVKLHWRKTQNRSTTVEKIEVLNHLQNKVKTPGIYNLPAT